MFVTVFTAWFFFISADQMPPPSSASSARAEWMPPSQGVKPADIFTNLEEVRVTEDEGLFLCKCENSWHHSNWTIWNNRAMTTGKYQATQTLLTWIAFCCHQLKNLGLYLQLLLTVFGSRKRSDVMVTCSDASTITKRLTRLTESETIESSASFSALGETLVFCLPQSLGSWHEE